MKYRTTLQSPACCAVSGVGTDPGPHSTCTLTRTVSSYDASPPLPSDRVKVRRHVGRADRSCRQTRHRARH